MVQIYVTCGVWRSSVTNEWSFVIDEEKRARLLTLESDTTLDELKIMVLEDYGLEQLIPTMELSFLPSALVNTSGSPPIVITTDRQLKNFVSYAEKDSSIRLCVTFAVQKVNTSLRIGMMSGAANTPNKNAFVNSNMSGVRNDVGDDCVMLENTYASQNIARISLVDVVKKGQIFNSRNVLKANMEMCAMKHNFDYRVAKSDAVFWSIRCKDNFCKWSLREQYISGSTCLIINKYVADHTCAPSNKSKTGKTASAKTIGSLIMHKYEGVKDGPKPNDIVAFMRTEHGCELSYDQAWEAREYAVSVVRGIPEKSFGKIPKYLHMMKLANPGTHTNYKVDAEGRFKYLFLAFGQCIRGFYNAIRRVIVVDGTFLKGKYKGVLLVATAIDGNSNLYPIAFGVVDSENDSSWEWFFMQLKLAIADDLNLAFVSDRNASIAKSLATIYPQARHGICIHHLLTNVVTYFKKKGMAWFVEKASKAYRVEDFQAKFNNIKNASPLIGKYLEDADVTKWARCMFPGFRYDIRTTNPAESINAALKSPREYPVIPLLDSIREMLTRWFYKHRELSSAQIDPMTIDVERKIDRRIEKGKRFNVFPINSQKFLVRGDEFDCSVDLERRTCTCGKYDLTKIPCRHAIRAIFTTGFEVHRFTDALYTTAAWRMAYAECINPIGVPEDAWHVPEDVAQAQVLPPESRRSAGRRKKRRHETVEDRIRSSQGAKITKTRRCSRCGGENHNRATCDVAI